MEWIIVMWLSLLTIFVIFKETYDRSIRNNLQEQIIFLQKSNKEMAKDIIEIEWRVGINCGVMRFLETTINPQVNRDKHPNDPRGIREDLDLLLGGLGYKTTIIPGQPQKRVIEKVKKEKKHG